MLASACALALALALAASACALAPPLPASLEGALSGLRDGAWPRPVRVYVARRVHTMEAAQPEATAVAVDRGRIAAVG
ncbi:MAG: hypothetical protein KC560_02780, partial [Myxococcales bacterium]|nr:hypothetical protein [Myxococcales bacterium]